MRTLALLAALALPSAVAAQLYSIDWFSIDGGGGTSTGDVYSVSGVIGQPDAGISSEGPYNLIGGFWALVAALPSQGMPSLSVITSPGSGEVIISWPLGRDDFRLEQTSNLTAAPEGWTLVEPTTYRSNDQENFITIPEPVREARFYRLRKP